MWNIFLPHGTCCSQSKMASYRARSKELGEHIFRSFREGSEERVDVADDHQRKESTFFDSRSTYSEQEWIGDELEDEAVPSVPKLWEDPSTMEQKLGTGACEGEADEEGGRRQHDLSLVSSIFRRNTNASLFYGR